jgi:hypothetical protein
MFVMQRTPVFAELLAGVIFLAAALWLDLRREHQRRRFARNVELLLNQQDQQKGRHVDIQEEQFKRAA